MKSALQSRYCLGYGLLRSSECDETLNTTHSKPTSEGGICGDLGINSKTPNQILTRRLPDTKCINASPRIHPVKIRKKKNNEK